MTLAAVFANDERQLAGELTAQGNLGRPAERFDFSGVKKYRELAPLLGDQDIDALDLCLPTFMHEEVPLPPCAPASTCWWKNRWRWMAPLRSA